MTGISSIAGVSDWPEQARRIEEAIQRPERFGLSSGAAVIREIAQTAGCGTSTLRQRLDARRYIAKRHPQYLAALSAGTPMRALLTLAGIEKLAPDVALDLLPGALSGEHSVRDLNRRLRYLRTVPRKGPDSPPADPYVERRAFDHAVGAFLSKHIDLISEVPGASLFPADRKRSVPADYVVVASGREIAVVEVKSSPTTFHGRPGVEVMGILALHAMQGVAAWLVVPAAWRRALDRIQERADQLELPSGIHFATFDPEGEGQAAFTIVSRL